MSNLNALSLGSLDLTIRKEKAKSYDGLMNSFTGIENDREFVAKLKDYQKKEWVRSKDDLFVWIPVLNRIDNIFKEIIDTHQLDITIPTLKEAHHSKKEAKSHSTEKKTNKKTNGISLIKGSSSLSTATSVGDITKTADEEEKKNGSHDAFLMPLPKDVESLALDMIEFSVFLLENTTGRSVYSSMDRMLALLNVPNMHIKLGCMKVLAINASRSLKTWAPNKLIKTDVMDKSLIIALSLLCFTSIDNGEESTFNLFLFLSRFSPESFDLQNVEELNIPVNNFLPFAFKYYSEKNDCFEVFRLSKDIIWKTSYEGLLKIVKQQRLIPEHYWFKLSVELYLVKCFVTKENTLNLQNRKDELKTLFDMLNPFVQLKFYCVGLVNCLVTAPRASSVLFELDGNIFDCLCNLALCGYPLEKEREGFSLAEIRHSALFALECISSKQVWCLDILKCIGGNVSHGSLFMLFERLRFALGANENVDERFNIQFFSMLNNLSSVASINEALVSSGLINELTKLLSLPNCSEYITLLHASTVLKNTINSFDAATVFQSAGGYTFLITTLKKEIDFCINHPNMNEGVEYYTKVYYTIQFKQLSFLRSLLKQLLNIINLDSSDRIRNLMDSSILDTLNKMLLNKNIFGFTLISYVLNIIQTLLNKEPTIFQILQESSTISIVLNNFAELIGPWPNLLLTLPQIVSAICLNKDALQEVISKNIIHFLFEPLRNIELAKGLVNDMDTEYGSLLDELYRHHPALQDTLEKEFLLVLNEFDRGEYTENLFMTDKNGNFFDIDSKSWATKEVPDSLASVYDYTDVGILTKMTVLSLYACNWKNVIKQLKIDFILNGIFKEGIPFSFTYSDTYVAITDVIKGSDLWDTEETLRIFFKIIHNCLQNVSIFLNYSNKKSFLLTAGNSNVLQVANSLNLLYSVLHVVVYAFFGNEAFSHLKVIAMSNLNKENEAQISNTFQLLGKLFTRILRENTLIQDSLDPQQDANTTPIKIYLIDIRKDKSLKSTIFQESFINNVFVAKTWFYGIQISSISIFKAILRSPLIKKNTLQGLDKYYEIKNMESAMGAIVNILEDLLENGKVNEMLIGLYHVKCALSKNAIGYQGLHRYIEFPAASLFYRFRGNELLFKMMMKMVSLMNNSKGVEYIDIPHEKCYNRDINTLIPKVFQYCLKLLSWTTSIENCELDQSKFEELFRKIMSDSSNYCHELTLQTKTLNSFELKKLFEQEGLLDFIFSKDRKLTDSCFISVLEFILAIIDVKQLMMINRDSFQDVQYLHSGFTNYFYSFREAIQRPKTIDDDNLWNDVYEDLLYSYENDESCNLELILEEKYSDAKTSLINAFEKFRQTPKPIIVSHYPQDVNISEDLLLVNTKMLLQRPDTKKKIEAIGELLILYPNCTIHIAEFYEETNQLLSKKEKDAEKLKFNMLAQVKAKFLATNKIESSWIHFVAVILSNTRLDPLLLSMLPKIDLSLKEIFENQFTADNMSSSWVPYFLFLYEQLITYSMVPAQDLKDEIDAKLPLVLNATFKKVVFQALLRFKNIKTVYLGYSISRMLLLFSRDLSLIKDIINSQILSEILKCIGINQKDPLVSKLQTMFIILSRSCFENEVVIENIMLKSLNELNKSLAAFMLNKGSLIFRNQDVFLKALKRKHTIIHNNWIKSNEFLTDDEKKNDSKPIEEKLTLENKTGVIHLLFSQLMASFKKDWITEDVSDNKNEFSVDRSANRVYNYIKFLLSTLNELVTAYKQSKLELLTFSKRNVIDQVPKPRSTSINFLLHQLLPVTDFENPVEYKKKVYLSNEAKKLIVSFMQLNSSHDNLLIPNINSSNDDFTSDIEDPDIKFLRKHVIESIIKLLSNSFKKQQSQFITELERLKIIATLNLIPDLLSRNMKDEEIKKNMAKIMIDMDLPNHISLIMNKVDMSFTKEAADINTAIINALYLIQSIVDSDVMFFKIENTKNNEYSDDDQQHNESDVDLSDDNNMFKNSALAMYDIEDIEEEIMDDESLFDEEIDDEDDVAFVDNEALEGSLELLSDDEEDDRDHNMFDPMIDSEADIEDEENIDDYSNADEQEAINHDSSIIDDELEDDQMDSEDDEGVIYLDNEGMILDEDDYVFDNQDEEVDDNEFNSFNDQELYDTDLNQDYDEDDESSSFSFNEDGFVGEDSEFADSNDDNDHLGNESDDSGILQYQITPGATRTIDLSNHRQRQQPIGFTRRNSILGSPSDFLGFMPPQFDTLARETLGDDFSADGTSVFENQRGSSLRTRSAGLNHILSNTDDLLRNQENSFNGVNSQPQQSSASYYLSSFFHRNYAEDSYVSSLKRWEQIANMFVFENSLFIPFQKQVVAYLAEESKIWKEKYNIQEQKTKKLVESRMETLKRKASEAGLDDILHPSQFRNNRRRASTASIHEAVLSESESESEIETEHQHPDPVYVEIGGRQINIAGTDIDQEYLMALPANMRDEVFYHHVAEDRARRLSHGDSDNNGIRVGYLASLPSQMRNRILAAQIRYESEDEEEINDSESENDENENTNNAGHTQNGATIQDEDKSVKSSKAASKILLPFLDRASVFSMVKSFFVYQPYMKRETHHSFFEKLCSTKSNRNELLNLLLLIISEGISSKNSLTKIFNFICNKIEQLLNPSTFAPKNYQLPSNCLYTNVASQCIDCLSHLITNCSSVKLFFASNQDNLLVLKHRKYLSTKGDLIMKNSTEQVLNKFLSETNKNISISVDDFKLNNDEEKCPLNYLINCLFTPVVGEEVTLMDSVTKIIQVTVKALVQLKQKNVKCHGLLMANTYKLLTASINLEASTTRGLQNILMTLLSLKISDPSKESLIIDEFITLANNNTDVLKNELQDLIQNVSKFDNQFGSSLNQLISKMSLSSSSQAILLKCTTSIDFIFFEDNNKKRKNKLRFENLENYYSQMKLDDIWGLLSKFLDTFETEYDTSSNVNKISFLLPLLEALMIICKITVYNNKVTQEDFKVAELSKFCHNFIAKHKVLLNSMIRTTPKLMNGPFSILLKLDSSAIDFDNKRFYFINKLKQEVFHDENSVHKEIPVDINRAQVFLDSYRVLFFKSIKDFTMAKFNITFQGEQGVDAGGVKREWYQIISRQMVNPDYALFVPVHSDASTFHPNRTSGINPEHLSFFKFIGMLLAKSIRDNCYIDSHFSRAVYKQILGKNVSLKDMESIDPDYYKSLCWILENDITDVLEMTFSVDTDDYGEHKVIDLKPNGSNIDVTEKNKIEYVERMINYKLKDSVKEQMDNLIQGFYSVISKENITIFNEKELELLMNGLPDIDVDDWKNNTTYVNYSATSKEINYFWRALRSFSKDERAKLLQFVTGTSKVPLDGFKMLAGVNGTSKFSIHKDFGSDDRLPQSHTCFNQLDLPSYKSYEDLKRALLIAINEGHEGFGLK